MQATQSAISIAPLLYVLVDFWKSGKVEAVRHGGTDGLGMGSHHEKYIASVRRTEFDLSFGVVHIREIGMR